MSETAHILIYRVEDQRQGLLLANVERVLLAMEVTPLPKAPETILGVINIRGAVIPVVNMRKKLRLPEREMELTDRIILSKTSSYTLALLVDNVEGLAAWPANETVAPDRILPGLGCIHNVIKDKDNLLLVYNIDEFFGAELDLISSEESRI